VTMPPILSRPGRYVSKSILVRTAAILPGFGRVSGSAGAGPGQGVPIEATKEAMKPAPWYNPDIS